MVPSSRSLWILLAFCMTSICGDQVDRIVGGTNARAFEFPYQASMRRGGRHICGGSIVHERFILTASHCVVSQAVDEITVVVGSYLLNSGGDTYKVEKLIHHENYQAEGAVNDIGLIKLSSQIVFKEGVKKVDLPTQIVLGGVQCVLTGWGYKSYPGSVPNVLQKLDLVTISLTVCQARYRARNEPVPDERNICTLTKRGEGACFGDSGGPLVRLDSKQQIGIMSHGEACGIGYPDISTNVYKYVGWIKNKFATE